MSSKAICALLASAVSLTACGGGGGGGQGGAVVSTPVPPAPSGAPVANFLASPQTQEFTVSGVNEVLGGTALHTDAASLPRIRYDAGRNSYEILLPGGAWQSVGDDPHSANAGTNQSWRAGPTYLTNYTAPDIGVDTYRYAYTSLVSYSDRVTGGDIAFGILTPAGAVPTTGSASYEGLLAGRSTEQLDYGDGGQLNTLIQGSITFAFDFGSGELTGAVHPVAYAFDMVALPSMDFANTVYATGATSFSGHFVTALAGANGFSGRFAGPAATELMGDFRFPYASPIDGKTYDAAGAFVAKR